MDNIESVKIPCLVIGRHAGEIPGVEVVEKRAIVFPETSNECLKILDELQTEANSRQITLLFQAVPGQLAIALAKYYGVLSACIESGKPRPATGPMLGIIISKPGPRLAGVEKEFTFYTGNDAFQAIEAIKMANPNAWTENRSVPGDMGGCAAVRVDPPMKFEFSHIEWL